MEKVQQGVLLTLTIKWDQLPEAYLTAHERTSYVLFAHPNYEFQTFFHESNCVKRVLMLANMSIDLVFEINPR